MSPLLMPNLRVCLQHLLPVLSRNVLNLSHKNVSQCFRVGGVNTFCTKNINNHAVDKRKAFKSRDFAIKERPVFPKSVFAAGTARRTAELMKKKAGFSDTDEPSDYSRKKRAAEIPDHPLTSSEWKIMKEGSERPDRFVLRMMEGMLSASADINIAKSLLAYVAVDTGTVPYELLLRYLTLCVNDGHWDEMYDVYDIMKSRFRTLDTGAYSLLVKGFSKTERWQETLVLLENINKIITPSPRNYANAIAAAMKHGSSATAWTLYNQLLEKGISPNQDTWKYLFEGGVSDHEYDDELLSILQQMRDNQIYPDEILANTIRKWFER